MPVVPLTPKQPQTLPMPDNTYIMMAAAQMHREGRLVETEDKESTVQTVEAEKDKP